MTTNDPEWMFRALARYLVWSGGEGLASYYIIRIIASVVYHRDLKYQPDARTAVLILQQHGLIRLGEENDIVWVSLEIRSLLDLCWLRARDQDVPNLVE